MTVLSALKKLVEVDLHSNSFKGTLPMEISAMVACTYVDCDALLHVTARLTAFRCLMRSSQELQRGIEFVLRLGASGVDQHA